MDSQISIDEIGMRYVRLGALVLTAGYRPIYRRLPEQLELAAVHGVAAAWLDGELITGRRLACHIPPDERSRTRYLSALLQAENRDSSDVGDLDLMVDIGDEDPCGFAETAERLRSVDDRMRLLETGQGRLFLGLATMRTAAAGQITGFASACRQFECGAVLDVPAYAQMRAAGAALPRPMIVRLEARTHRHLVAEPATARMFERLRKELSAAGIALMIDGISSEADLAQAIAAGVDYCSGEHLGAAQPAGVILDRSTLAIGAVPQAGRK